MTTASEKLRALQPTHLTVKAGADDPYPVGAVTLYDVPLPQIVAVVEAAEKHVDMEWAAFAEFGEPEHGDMPPNTNVTNARLAAALTALDEALS